MKVAIGVIALIALWALYYLLPIEYRLLWQPDETRYAEISRGMLASGDWVVPRFLGIRYFEKPIAGYWINNLGQLLFGHSNLGVRIGAILSTSLTAGLVAWLSWRIWRDKRLALFSAIIYLTCLLVYGVGTYAVLDPMVALWLGVAMCSFWYAAQSESRNKKVMGYLLLGLACGIGVMTKGFLALVVPVISVLPWVLAEKRSKELLLYGPLAVVSATLITLPWALMIAQREPEFWHYFFWVEHIQRFAEDDAQHRAPFWYYLPVLLLGTLPWLGFLPGALCHGWQRRKQNSGTLYLLGWVVMPLLFFSLAKGKLLTYILPCFAALAPLLAFHALQSARTLSRSLKVNGIINLLFGIAGVLAVCVLLTPKGTALLALDSPLLLSQKLAIALIFIGWMLFGYLSLRQRARHWAFAALCPLALALLIGVTIPTQVINAKQPQAMIGAVREELASSRYILSNNVGVAAGIAWELQRDDIVLYDRTGELRWGLQFADSATRFVPRDDFTDWLATHRLQGAVTLVLLVNSGETLASYGLPTPDGEYRQGRFLVVEYHAR